MKINKGNAYKLIFWSLIFLLAPLFFSPLSILLSFTILNRMMNTKFTHVGFSLFHSESSLRGIKLLDWQIDIINDKLKTDGFFTLHDINLTSEQIASIKKTEMNARIVGIVLTVISFMLLILLLSSFCEVTKSVTEKEKQRVDEYLNIKKNVRSIDKMILEKPQDELSIISIALSARGELSELHRKSTKIGIPMGRNTYTQEQYDMDYNRYVKKYGYCRYMFDEEILRELNDQNRQDFKDKKITCEEWRKKEDEIDINVCNIFTFVSIIKNCRMNVLKKGWSEIPNS